MIVSLPDEMAMTGGIWKAWQPGADQIVLDRMKKENIPLFVRARRTERNLTQDDVAKVAGIKRGSYSNIERGKCKPSVPVARKIANALGFDWVLFFTED